MRENTDIVIVGSGTAGSTLAARLSEDPKCKVTVLEAGAWDGNPWLRLPVGYFKSIYNPKVSRLFKGAPDDGIAGRQMDIPRGRVVGGSSSINGLIYIRGQQQDFDDWETLGAKGWGYRDVLAHFRRIETFHGPASQFRGAAGPLNVSRLRNENLACEAWLDAARQFGLPDNPDFNAEETFGVGKYDLTLRGRWRDSAATAYVHPARRRKNLTVITRAQVTGLSFEGSRVSGVTYQKDGHSHEIRATSQVILCAGAIQSPHILMLSGIGPASHLADIGITPRIDAPEVGQNLQDHLQMRTIVELANPGLSLNTQIRNPLTALGFGWDWLARARGPLTVGAGQVGGAACSAHAIGGRPDLQLFVMPLSVDKPGTPLHRFPGFTVSYWQCHPESRGQITLGSADPLADPVIQTNYLTADMDRRVMVDGLGLVREIYHQPAFRDAWTREVVPGAEFSEPDQALQAIQRFGGTVYHPVGTCRMGGDPTAVVDPSLRVNGVDGLRVVDASVMPKITSANTNAATFMIAEKAADMIKADL